MGYGAVIFLELSVILMVPVLLIGLSKLRVMGISCPTVYAPSSRVLATETILAASLTILIPLPLKVLCSSSGLGRVKSGSMP